MFKLTKIRKELLFNKEIGGIINVLKGVASSEFYRLQKTRKRLEEVEDYLRGFFHMVKIAELKHMFVEDSSSPDVILLITSDSGFLGSLNMAVVNSALEQCSGKEKIIIVGIQGARYMDEMGKSFTSFAGISDEVGYEEAKKVGDYLISNFLDRNIGRTIVVYPHFVSFALWQVRSYQLLPCRFLFPGDSKDKEEKEKIIIEPSMSLAIEYLIKMWLNYMLYGIFWESKLSEWSARTMHLEGSSSEIKRLDKKLRFQYFRLLHEASDRNIRETFSSRLSVKRTRQLF